MNKKSKEEKQKEKDEKMFCNGFMDILLSDQEGIDDLIEYFAYKHLLYKIRREIKSFNSNTKDIYSMIEIKRNYYHELIQILQSLSKHPLDNETENLECKDVT